MITQHFLTGDGSPGLERQDEVAQLAHDLHDGPGQALVAIGLLVHGHLARHRVDAATTALLRHVAELADGARLDLERLARGTLLEATHDPNLFVALHDLAATIEEQAGIEVDVVVEGGPVEELGDQIVTALYRVVREAVGNAWRHGQCTRVAVALTVTRRWVALRVADDGIGVENGNVRDGLGIMGMRRALAGIGGWLRIDVSDGRGLVVEAGVPRGLA